MDNAIKYPRLLKNVPCGEDLFEGKSQEKIATNICEVIKNEKDCNIIGIDGGWGSGKSNLVKQIENRLTKEGYHFFMFDAWGHQEDLQRRSFLEELTEYLVNSKLVSPSWNERLKKLLAKTKETESKKVPKLSIGVLVIALLILITPISNSMADRYQGNWWSDLLLLAPTIILIILFIIYFLSEKKAPLFKRLKQAFNKLFLEYQNKIEEDTIYETISEEEPSVRKFREWLRDISSDLGNKQLVLIFDNMDRLPPNKVQELWSSIHVFFCENSHDNIKVIIPFDREHIREAFKFHDDQKEQYGDDFINKTFNVVYRVSPPILSDWKSYFTTQWNLAFGELLSQEGSENVLQIFDILHKDITPRNIISFINEFVTIKTSVRETVPDNYIALFILGKSTIQGNPIDEILKPTYLGSLGILYSGDEDLPKFIAALFYQVEPDKSIQIVFADKIRRALSGNDNSELQKLSHTPTFYYILENVISGVVNVENAILALHCIPPDRIGNQYQNSVIWNCLYKRINFVPKVRLDEYEIVLLKHIRDKETYAKQLINQMVTFEGFTALEYFGSITNIRTVIAEDVMFFSLLPEKSTTSEDFISFVKVAKSDYLKYNIKVDEEELNTFLSTQSISSLGEMNYLPFLTREYSLKSFSDTLVSLIQENSSKHPPSSVSSPVFSAGVS